MKFYIKQKVFTLKDKFNITDDQQNQLYQVKGKFMSIKNKLDLLDKADQLVLHAEKKVFSFMPKYFIYDPKMQEIAQIQRRFGFRPKFYISVLKKDFRLEGNLFAHSFTILDRDTVVATISKKIFSWGDTYEIEVEEQENVELFLFVVIILDQILHEKKKSGIRI